MSRIPLVNLDEQPESIRQWAARRGNLNVFRLSQCPQRLWRMDGHGRRVVCESDLEARMRELVILRVAHLQASRYELGQHVPLARSAGLADQQIDAIQDAGDLEKAGFARPERVALDVVTELCATHRLSNDSFACAHGIFGDEAFTELLMLISCYYGLALVLDAADPDVDVAARFRP